MAGNKAAVAHFEKITRTEATDKRMPVSRSNVGATGNNLVAICGFSYVDTATTIEPLCEGRGEALWHVLDGNNPRTILRHLFEHLKQGFRASGGGSDGDNLFPMLRGWRQDSGRNHDIGGVVVWGGFAKPAKFCHAGRRRRPPRGFWQNGGIFPETP